VEGDSFPELAKELDISESAVKMRVSRGTKNLRDLDEARTAADAAGSKGRVAS
jgi:DNA-directed RNA polymerase specialized sigma24 family protein